MKRKIRKEGSFLGGSHAKGNIFPICEICELKEWRAAVSHNVLLLIFVEV
jgi:hypothetical protein